MEIEFEGQYSKSQYFKGVYLAAKPSTQSTALRVAVFVVFTGILIVLAISTIQDDPTDFRVSRLFRHLITALILGFVVFRPYLNIYQTASRLWGDRMQQGVITGVVTTQGIVIGDFQETWDRFNFKRVAVDMVVLLSADRMMVLLMRDFFKSEGDWNRAVKLIEHKVVEPR